MKISLITIILLLQSFPSFGEWVKVDKNIRGDVFYVNFNNIKKHNGFIYYWELIDLLNPSPSGKFSYKSYYQLDCNIFRRKTLNFSIYEEPMGKGKNFTFNPEKGWEYPDDVESTQYVVMKKICS